MPAAKNWKPIERATAKLLGESRLANNGMRQADITSSRYHIEHKSRKTKPEWWVKADAALAECPPDKIPLLIYVYAPGIKGKKLERYAILRLEDFIAITEETPEEV